MSNVTQELLEVDIFFTYIQTLFRQVRFDRRNNFTLVTEQCSVLLNADRELNSWNHIVFPPIFSTIIIRPTSFIFYNTRHPFSGIPERSQPNGPACIYPIRESMGLTQIQVSWYQSLRQINQLGGVLSRLS